jgi:hypothetical protein
MENVFYVFSIYLPFYILHLTYKLRFFLKINLVVVHHLIIVKTFFYQVLISMDVDVEVFIQFKHTFKNLALLFYRRARYIKAIANFGFMIGFVLLLIGFE